SRPIPGRPWEYLFYLDVAAGTQELRAARALMHLAEFAPSSKTLGSYPSVQSATPRAAITSSSATAASALLQSGSGHQSGAGSPASEKAAAQ
ncbi:MAG TPA: hypothetical protein VEK82_13350, partial [Stellaceae bacterium]|nr:hypothetical protein [Stellaceae bacterium]